MTNELSPLALNELLDAGEPRECCPDWKEQTDIINGYITTTSIRYGQDTFKGQGGKPFKYCAWCGTMRPENIEDV